jgi:hypothetical protein
MLKVIRSKNYFNQKIYLVIAMKMAMTPSEVHQNQKPILLLERPY